MNTLGAIISMFVILLVLAYMPDSCGKYVSPAESTAQYEVHEGGFWGTTYYTNNYTQDNENTTLHGYWNKYHAKDSNEQGNLVFPNNKIDSIATNPNLNKGNN